MSKVSKHNIIIPSGVKATIESCFVKFTSSLGDVKVTMNECVTCKIENDSMSFSLNTTTENRTTKSIIGTMYSSSRSAINDVTKKCTKEMTLVGVGYKAAFANGFLTLFLGFSHQIKIAIPTHISVTVNNNTKILISGIDRSLVMSICGTIRSFRKPEPYKGKGVFYEGETIIKKEGKKK